AEADAAYEEGKDSDLHSLQRGVDETHDRADGIRKSAKDVDGINQPVEAHQMRNEAREPPGECCGAQIFRMDNRPEKRDKSYPSSREQNRRKERSRQQNGRQKRAENNP